MRNQDDDKVRVEVVVLEINCRDVLSKPGVGGGTIRGTSSNTTLSPSLI